MSAAIPAAARREPVTAVLHRCPLCGGTFAEEQHCAICPMTRYCHTLCCPNCGYSYVERSSLVDLVRHLVARLRRRAAPGGGRG